MPLVENKWFVVLFIVGTAITGAGVALGFFGSDTQALDVLAFVGFSCGLLFLGAILDRWLDGRWESW